MDPKECFYTEPQREPKVGAGGQGGKQREQIPRFTQERTRSKRGRKEKTEGYGSSCVQFQEFRRV